MRFIVSGTTTGFMITIQATEHYSFNCTPYEVEFEVEIDKEEIRGIANDLIDHIDTKCIEAEGYVKLPPESELEYEIDKAIITCKHSRMPLTDDEWMKIITNAVLKKLRNETVKG